MLYDPRWEVKTKKPSLAGFIAWLETKNPRERYNFQNCDGHCAVDQYYASVGIDVVGRGIPSPRELWGDLNRIASRYRTFGGLLKAARVAQVAND
jgi:hypothetical protein